MEKTRTTMRELIRRLDQVDAILAAASLELTDEREGRR
jgi:hypothetical protein